MKVRLLTILAILALAAGPGAAAGPAVKKLPGDQDKQPAGTVNPNP